MSVRFNLRDIQVATAEDGENGELSLVAELGERQGGHRVEAVGVESWELTLSRARKQMNKSRGRCTTKTERERENHTMLEGWFERSGEEI